MKNFQNLVTGKNVIISLIVTYTVYAIMLFYTIPILTEYSGGKAILDLMPTGYSVEYAQTLFANLGSEGRAFYLSVQLPIDFVYPLLFAISGWFMLVYFFKKLNLLNRIWKWFLWLPIIAGIGDYLENIGIIQLLNSFPAINSTTVSLTSSFSLIKSMATTVYFIVLITVILILVIRKVKPKIEIH